jgi:mRNA interferase RelE/StbE
MGYVIEFVPSAVRELERLPRDTQARISSKIDQLAMNPRPSGAKRLRGTADRWRIRIGDYRVIYDIHDRALRVLVLKVGHRRDVYRRR